MEDNLGHFVISSNGGWVHDSLFWSSTTCLIILDSAGDYVSVSNIDVPDKLTYNGRSRSLVQLTDGRFVIGGSTWDNTTIDFPALYWFSAVGQALSYAEIASLPQYIVRQMNKAHDDGFVMLGDALIGNDIQAFVLKTDSAGQLEWSQLFGSAAYDDYFWSIEPAPDGTYYIGGVKGVGNNSWDPWLLRVDSLGNEIWSFTNGTAYNDLGQAHLATLIDGNFVYGSGEPTGNSTDQRPQLVKVDSTGTILWTKVYDIATHSASVLGVKEVQPSGDLIACGTSVPITPYIDGFLLRTNSQGDSVWLRHYWYTDSIMNDGTGLFFDVTPTSDGGFVAVGTMMGSIAGDDPPGASQDVWVVKVDSLGCIIPGCDDFSTVVTVQATNLTHALSVYPNPARERTTVKVTLLSGSPLLGRGAGGEGALTLRLVSSQGQEVLVQRAVNGENEVSLRGLAAGIHYIHLTSGSTWLSGTKLVVE